MKTVSATDAKQGFAALLDIAQREPVAIRRHDRDVAVILSAEDYQRLLDARADDFQQFCDRIGKKARRKGLTEAKLAALLADDAT
jgi:antitoxin Phd